MKTKKVHSLSFAGLCGVNLRTNPVTGFVYSLYRILLSVSNREGLTLEKISIDLERFLAYVEAKYGPHKGIQMAVNAVHKGDAVESGDLK